MVIIALVVGLAAGYGIATMRPTHQGPTTISTSSRITGVPVVVNGTVDYNCVGIQVQSVTFTDQSGNSFTTNVKPLSSAIGWDYSISLNSGQTYNITVTSKTVTPVPQTYTANEGSLKLVTTSPTYTFNIGSPC